jgi:hypothetical protein
MRVENSFEVKYDRNDMNQDPVWRYEGRPDKR